MEAKCKKIWGFGGKVEEYMGLWRLTIRKYGAMEAKSRRKKYGALEAK